MRFVVGIFGDHDAVANLAYALKSGGFDTSGLTVISDNEPIGYLRQTEASFIRKAPQAYTVVEPPRMHFLKEVAFDLPGDALAQPPEDYYSHPELEALSELCVPDGRTDSYTSAIDSGLWVAGYKANEQVDAIVPLFTG